MRTVKILALCAVLMFFAATATFAAVRTPVTDDSYRTAEPEIDQCGTLTAYDFIVNTSSSELVASFDGDAPASDVPGEHPATVKVRGLGGYEKTLTLTYTVKRAFCSDVTVEAGDSVPGVGDIALTEDAARGAKLVFPGGEPDMHKPGSCEAYIEKNGCRIPVTVRISDTVPPTAEPRFVTIENGDAEPVPGDFVENITDATDTVCTFAGQYDFTQPAEFDVVITVADAVGNTATVISHADCNVDSEPPVIEGLDDMYVTVGDSVAYKSGVSVSDNSGGNVKLDIDAGGVSVEKAGEYTVTYTATDEAGNKTEAQRKLYVIEKSPPSRDEVMAAMRKVYDKYVDTRPDMSKYDIAYAIYRYAHDNIHYVNGGVDKSNYLIAAMDGIEKLSGDCFTYMSVAKVLFEIADIPTIVVERDRHEGESRHYWLLVNVGDGWYHFDATKRRTCPEFETFLRTDAELMWYRENYEEHYYRFVSDAYPERGVDSYYD